MENFKETKEFLKLGFEIIKAVDDSYEDDNLDYKDIPHFIGVLDDIAPGIEGVDQIISEYENASDEQKQALHDWCKTEFDLADDELEEKVERYFNVAVAAFDLYLAVKGVI